MHLLLAEDDPELSRQLVAWLHDAGHRVQVCDHGIAALKAALTTPFDAVVLDVGLPEIDGFKIVEALRARENRVPVLFLTARDGVTDRIKGLKVGGDDYMVKPFAFEELGARLEALHRRATHVQPAALRKVGRWTLDATLRRLKDGAETVDLQPREWTLLDVLMSNSSRVLTKTYLLEKVWDITFDPGTNVVDAMVCRLRRKLDEPGKPSHIQTIRGKGYVFQDLS